MPKKLYVISKFSENGNLKPEIYTNENDARKALNGLYIDYMCIGDVDNDDKHDNGFRVVYIDDTFTECQLFEVEME